MSFTRLALLYALGVLATLVTDYVVLWLLMDLLGGAGQGSFWQGGLLVWAALVTLVVVAGAGLGRARRLATGGSAVAQLLGAVPVTPSARNVLDRKLLMAVEELALAAGVPVPQANRLPDRSINAFAAAHGASDAVLGVTRGGLEQLTQTELRSLVAHLLIRLVRGEAARDMELAGPLFGLMATGLTGQRWMRRGHWRNPQTQGSPAARVTGFARLFAGTVLTLLGLGGLACGRAIQVGFVRLRVLAADREAARLIDAKRGLASVLEKIGGSAHGSCIEGAHAATLASFFFAGVEAAGSWTSRLAPTHPPLAERIGLIEPDFDGQFTPLPDDFQAPEEEEEGAPAPAPAAPAPAEAEAAAPAEVSLSADRFAERLAAATPQDVSYGAALLREIPPRLVEAARETSGAQAIIYSLLLDAADEDVRDKQLTDLSSGAEGAIYRETLALHESVRALGRRARLPLIDLALPALRHLSPSQLAAFADNVAELIAADERVDLFEFTLQTIVFHQLPLPGRAPAGGGPRILAMEPLGDDASTVLSVLAHTGHEDEDVGAAAYAAGMARLGLASERPMRAPDESTLDRFGRALERFARASDKLKRRLVDAAAYCVAHDGKVTFAEAELLRAIADSLGSPIPPFGLTQAEAAASPP